MIGLELSHLDQATVLFFIFSAIGLIRERKVLPFVIVLLGTIVHGPLIAVMLAALITWHRMDAEASMGIQFKDLFGVLLLLVSALSPAPVREFTALVGVAMMSLSFGRGMLGAIPALVLLRQYFQEPEGIEVVLSGAGIYWVAAEAMRWLKFKKQEQVLPVLEGLCTLVILYGFHQDFPKWMDDSALVALGSGIFFFSAGTYSWIHWKNEGFLRFARGFRSSLLKILVFGGRFFTDKEPWFETDSESPNLSLASAFDRIFYALLVTALVVGAFVLAGRGGFGS
jgi:hypothetical protein